MNAGNSQNRDERTLKSQLEGALDWWRDAGVDGDFTDDPIDRIAEAEAQQVEEKPVQPALKPAAMAKAKPAAAPNAPAVRIGGEENWPKSREAFAEWWVDDKSIDLGGTGPKIAPRGSTSAELMVLVSQPEDSDRDQLLSGQQGKLLAGFLRAADLTRENCYVASTLPHTIALPDWHALRAAGLGNLTAHHINLAKPKRLLVFARNVLPLLGHDQAQGSHSLGEKHGMTTSMPVLAAPGLEELLRSAQRRKRLWRDWLDWSA